jgi:hypothetical protein
MARRSVSEGDYIRALQVVLKGGIALSVRRMLAAHALAPGRVATFRSLGLAAGFSQPNTNRVYGQFAGRIRRALRLPTPEIELLAIASAPAPPIDAAEEFSFAMRPAFARALTRVGVIEGVRPLKARFAKTRRLQASTHQLFDGPLRRSQASGWERNREARRQCVAHFGAACQVCKFDFGKRYGRLGRGFVEVHHAKIPGSRSRRRRVDPLVDLVPVCSNCHRMLHRREPALGVGDLRRAIVRAV